MRLLAYEARRLGWAPLLGPLLMVIAVGFFGWLAAALGAPAQTNRILSGAVQLASLVGALGAVAAVATDPAIELRLSLPFSLRRSVLLRLAMTLLWAAAITAAVTASLHQSARLTSEIPGMPAADQLEWLPPMLLLAGAGTLTTVAARGSAPAAGLVAAAWVLSNIASRVWDSAPWLKAVWPGLPFDPSQPSAWFWNRGWLVIAGACGLAVTAWLLGRSEHLLGGDR